MSRVKSSGEKTAPDGIARHLKFIHDQESRAFAAEQPHTLRLERRDYRVMDQRRRRRRNNRSIPHTIRINTATARTPIATRLRMGLLRM